ncbi:hypothetical protein NDU88_002717 [Pleurodeles waltl]|uniref:Uncharacterized protein n=1 Tax=Pleurodeles waltl TaxID=8319 RepID=A0AAV7LD78_PLEWA|nr:hypothetical protein NDU88_002717 [Pleurodeles waltl]
MGLSSTVALMELLCVVNVFNILADGAFVESILDVIVIVEAIGDDAIIIGDASDVNVDVVVLVTVEGN